MEAWHSACKRHREALHDVQELGGKIKARCKPSGLSELRSE